MPRHPQTTAPPQPRPVSTLRALRQLRLAVDRLNLDAPHDTAAALLLSALDAVRLAEIELRPLLTAEIGAAAIAPLGLDIPAPEVVIIQVPIYLPPQRPCRLIHAVEARLRGWSGRKTRAVTHIHHDTQRDIGEHIADTFARSARDQMGTRYTPLPSDDYVYAGRPFPTVQQSNNPTASRSRDTD